MMGRMTRRPGSWRLRWWRLLLAALAAVLGVLLGAMTASATTLSAAETRVGASTVPTPAVVGVDQAVWASQHQVDGPPLAGLVVATGVAAKAEVPLIKAGSSGGETAGKVFPNAVKQQVLEENPNICVYCRMETESPQVDHAIPRARGGDATFENGQTTCSWCNASKGARDFPVNPPPGFEGAWPPVWWGPS